MIKSFTCKGLIWDSWLLFFDIAYEDYKSHIKGIFEISIC